MVLHGGPKDLDFNGELELRVAPRTVRLPTLVFSGDWLLSTGPKVITLPGSPSFWRTVLLSFRSRYTRSSTERVELQHTTHYIPAGLSLRYSGRPLKLIINLALYAQTQPNWMGQLLLALGSV